MLRNAIKIILFIYILTFVSCTSKNNNELYIEENFQSYSKTHKLIEDSIKHYINYALASFSTEYTYGFYIDSLICINSKQDKLVALSIEIPSSGKDFLSDDVMKLLGKKINGNWYFFKGGGTLMIPREMSKSSDFNPPKKQALSQIARKEFMAGGIIKKDGKLIVNDEWVNNHFEYNGMCAHCKTHEQYDSTHWQKIIDKWKKRIDTVTYKRFKGSPGV